MKELVEKYLKEKYESFVKIGMVEEHTYQCWFKETYLDLVIEIDNGRINIIDGLKTIDLIDYEIDCEEEKMVYDLLYELELVDVVLVNYNT